LSPLPVKVLYVINDLGVGGAERSLSELLPKLAEDGVEPVVVTLFVRPEGVHDRVENSGFSVRTLAPGGLRTWIPQLRRVIAQEHPAIVHTTNFEADIAGRVAAARTPAAVLTSLVNTSYDPVRLQDPNIKRWKIAVVRRVDALTARYLTAHFHAITEAVKVSAVRTLGVPAERITVIERGRDAARLGRRTVERRAQIRASLGVPDDRLVVLNVGRQEFQKGQEVLLRAMTDVVRRHPDALLLVAGRRGNASAELDQLHSTLGLGDQVRFLGHREDVPELLAGADVFTFPSLYEGLGGALIEAMALELPIVASDVPAIREVLGDATAGVLVPPGDAPALATELGGLLDDPDRRRALGAAARRRFEERFTLPKSAARMADLYRDVVIRAAGPASGPRRNV
jgi:glycosyltransferase involved in cell wall biosynthesis